VNIEDFLSDDIAIEEDTSECDPVNDFSRLSGSYFETPECEEDNNRIDDEREIRKWYTKNHGIRMCDDIGT
jgi:hypothetical protein